jgi:hypothetical protein
VNSSRSYANRIVKNSISSSLWYPNDGDLTQKNRSATSSVRRNLAAFFSRQICNFHEKIFECGRYAGVVLDRGNDLSATALVGQLM